MTSHPSSAEWQRRAAAVTPLGSQTLSKTSSQWVQGPAPGFLVSGRGSHVCDVDGNEYVDWPMALGPVLLGHAHPGVNEAIRRQLDLGITFTLPHPLEVQVAERVVAMCPGVEAVRFVKTGSDATSAAVRVARARTGRDLVLVGGYHGWHDWYIGSTTRDAGVPKAVSDLTIAFRADDLDHLDALLERHRGEVAAVVLEPSGAHVPEPGDLQRLVESCRSHGAISVFDEVITGFRVAPGGARERYEVQPDLSCYGKALGNGMPVAAVAGTWEVMRGFEEVFVSGTHGGETLSLAAARAVLDAIATGGPLAHIERLGRRLRDGLGTIVQTRAVQDRVRVGGEPARAVVTFPDDPGLIARSWVQQCFLEDGQLFNGSMFVCAEHSDADVDGALATFDRALQAIEAGEDLRSKLTGPPVSPVFREP